MPPITHVGAQKAAGTGEERIGGKAGNGKGVKGEGTVDQRQRIDVCPSRVTGKGTKNAKLTRGILIQYELLIRN